MALSSDVARRVAIKKVPRRDKKKVPHCGKRSAASRLMRTASRLVRLLLLVATWRAASRLMRAAPRLMRTSDHCDFLPPSGEHNEC